MKLIKTLPYYFLCFLILFGVFTTFFKTPDKQIHVDFDKFEQIVQDNQNKDMVLAEKEDGTLKLQVGNENYVTNVSPNSTLSSDLQEKYHLTYYYSKSVNYFSIFINIAVMVFLFYVLFGGFRQKNTPSNLKKVNAQVRENPTTTLDQVGGLPLEVKGEVMQAIEMLKDPFRAKLIGAPAPKGVLLYGPPGTGKTLLAKALANALGASFYSASGSSFMELYVGIGASRVRELFAEARKKCSICCFH